MVFVIAVGLRRDGDHDDVHTALQRAIKRRK